MTLAEITSIALSRIDEYAPDTQITSVIHAGINQGYMIVAANVDRIHATQTLTFAREIPLPANIIDVVRLTHDTAGELTEGIDYVRKGDSLLLRASDITSGNLTLTYTKFPARLVNDTDALEVDDAYAYVIATFGAYTYMMMHRKYDAAQLLLNEFAAVVPLQPMQAIKLRVPEQSSGQ